MVIAKAHKNLPRDVFLYLLSIATLVAVAISFGILVFQLINNYIPDIVTDPYGGSRYYFGPLRNAIATLIVVFPVFLWSLRFINKDMEQNPEKRDLKIRKWLLYFTLFVAAVVIIGDLIAIINSFLEGELTRRFIFKALTIIAIAGAIFFYYFRQLKEIPVQKGMRVFSGIVIAVILAAIAMGFVVAGSPQNQRLVRLDERRTGDLQFLQSQIVSYWQSKSRLPQDLDQLKNDLYNISAPVDPLNGQAYEYKVLGNLKFELCATFQTSNKNEDSPDADKRFLAPEPVSYPPFFENQGWQHDAERTCFERTIDPDIIKPLPK